MGILRTIGEFLGLIPVNEVVLPPSPGYGSDLWCENDLDDNCTELDENDSRIVRQALFRRFKTPRGTLIDDPSYGLDVASILNKGLTNGELRDAVSMIQNESIKDDRVKQCTVDAAQVSANTLMVSLSLTLVDSTEPFPLVMNLVDGELLLSEM
jgi:hypothetical protein